MILSFSFNGTLFSLKEGSTLADIREEFKIPSGYEVHRLAAPPQKLQETDKIKPGDQLVSGPKERFPQMN